MPDLDAASILIRTRAGARAVLVGEASGPTTARMQLLLRLNGHTALGDLAGREPLGDWLAVAEELVSAGLATLHDAHLARVPSQSQWGGLVDLPAD